MSRKRIVSLLLAALLCALLCACGAQPAQTAKAVQNRQATRTVHTMPPAASTKEALATEEASSVPSAEATAEASEPEERAAPTGYGEAEAAPAQDAAVFATVPYDGTQIPAYTGAPYVSVNEGVPFFGPSELTDISYEAYGDLDSLGRCTDAIASIGTDLMPTEKRQSIREVKPSGWNQAFYDIVESEALYNRCHLIGYQLSGENANEQNLITGTRYMNTEGMLPFENLVADYVKETDNHVLYRVTPIFQGDELVARGVLMEGQSVEDDGDGVQFCEFIYNVQPGIGIDYADGESWLEDGSVPASTGGGADVATAAGAGAAQQTDAEAAPAAQQVAEEQGVLAVRQEAEAQTEAAEARQAAEPATKEAPVAANTQEYVLNTNTHKFHKPSCGSVGDMNPRNARQYTGTRDEAISMGYDPCKRCNP